MVVYGKDSEGEKYLLGEPLSLVYKTEYDAASDYVKLSFSLSSEWPRLREIEIMENDETVFRGIVDEEISEYSSKGNSVSIVSRSLAALLTDNELMPQTIVNPSLSLFEARFLSPMGFTVSEGDRLMRAGRLDIVKGTSIYTALSDFAKKFLGSSFRVSNKGEISLGDYKPRRIEAGRILRKRISYCNYKVNSGVYLRDSLTKAYGEKIPNPCHTGITRERYWDSFVGFQDGSETEYLLSGAVWCSPGDILAADSEGVILSAEIDASSAGITTTIKVKEES